jgi:hypothetical protein
MDNVAIHLRKDLERVDKLPKLQRLFTYRVLFSFDAKVYQA